MLDRLFREFDLKDIRSWHPCYDPAKYLKPDWRGTIFDILGVRDCPFHERLWTVGRYELMSRSFIMDYGIRCIEHVSEHLKTPSELALFSDIIRFAEDLRSLSSEAQKAWNIDRTISLRTHACELAWQCSKADSKQSHRERENIAWAMAYLCSNFPIRAVMWANGAEPNPKDGLKFQEETLFKMLTEHMDGPHLF